MRNGGGEEERDSSCRHFLAVGDEAESLERTLRCEVGFADYSRPRSRRTRSAVAPISAGASTIVAPASARAVFFATAVPLLPEMIAPAWPMRRPAGAVEPAMKAMTGFRMWRLM